MRRIVMSVALAVALGPLAAQADTPADAFLAAWAGIDNYTDTVTSHEVLGSAVADSTFHLAYKKPHFIKIDILAGPNKGGGAVWTGGDTLTGHQGGMMSFVKMAVPITDKRVTSLRGDTIERASWQSIADDLKADKIDPATSEVTVDGVDTDAVSMAPPPSPGGVTREVVYLARTTHLPVRLAEYAGDTLVKQETYTDVKVNPGLTEGDFH